ncbi:mCG148167 [Mus musculus]|nr:mCG148167 [Mus musculus]
MVPPTGDWAFQYQLAMHFLTDMSMEQSNLGS